MGITADLLNAQRRPDTEAQRLTEALTAALNEERDDASLIPSAALTETSAAYHQLNQEIADEKLPPRRPISSGNRAEFVEPTNGPNFADEQHGTPPLAANPRYLLDDEDEEDSTPGDREEALAEVPDEDVTESVAEATASLKPSMSEPAADSVPGFDPVTRVDNVDDSGEFGSSIEPSEEAPSEATGAVDDEQAQHSGEAPADGDEPGGPPQPAKPLYTDIPSPLDAYAAAQTTWDDQQELPLDSDEPATATESEHTPADDESDAGDETDNDHVDLAPSDEATAPPDDIDAPEAAAEPGIRERMLNVGASAAHWLRKDRSRGKKCALITGAFILTIGGIFVAAHGGRGNPPEPAGQIATSPPAIDNPEPSVGDEILVPAKVSASCGNDSDGVGPFSANKDRAWVCDRINGLDLNVLNIIFDKPVVITSICIVPGWNYVAPDGRDEWARHRLTTSVTWRMGGKVYPQKITPTRTGVCKQFPAVVTQEMSMTITASMRPPVGEGEKHSGIGAANSADDPSKVDETTAVSSIEIKGHPVNPAG